MAQRNFQNSFQWSDDLSIQSLARMLESGFAVAPAAAEQRPLQQRVCRPAALSERRQFLAARPVSYTRNIGNPFTGLRATEFNAYVQDDWQIHPRLLLNLGLRYELNTVPVEVNGLIADEYRFKATTTTSRRVSLLPGKRTEGQDCRSRRLRDLLQLLELSFIGLTRFNPPLITNVVANSPVFPDL